MSMTELPLLWLALVGNVVAGVLAIISQVMQRRPERTVLGLLVFALLALTAAVIVRWLRLGHGPFSTLFEILLSNIWSLWLIFTLAYWRIAPLRPSASIVLPILFVVMGWMMVSDPVGGSLPQTFDTVWLYIHIGFGKIFLGSLLIAVGLAGVILLRRTGRERFGRMPNDASLDELAYRFMALGLIFDTLMLVSGAIWAHEAWGRYWGWDPLETSSFVTWVLLALAIHLRATHKPRSQVSAMLVLAAFVMSFVTFIGVPFLTAAPHAGTFS